MSIQANVFGRLTDTPQVNSSKTGTAYTTFSLAVNHGKDADGNDLATFVRLTAFGKTGELIAKNCDKGKRLSCTADLRMNNWTDNNGAARQSLQGNVSHIDIVDWPDDQSQGQPAQQAPARQAPPQAVPYGTPPQQAQYQAPPQQPYQGAPQQQQQQQQQQQAYRQAPAAPQQAYQAPPQQPYAAPAQNAQQANTPWGK